MSVKKLIFEVGFDKNGEAEFGVVGTVTELTYLQMKNLREMIVVGIGVMENMWRDSQQQPAEADILKGTEGEK